MLPITILGAIGAIRDELIEPRHPEVFKVAHWLPDWRWQTYLLVVAFAFVLFLLENSYRTIWRRDRKLADFFDLYAHALSFDGLVFSHDETNEVNNLELRVIFGNRIDRPIKYLVEKYEVSSSENVVIQATNNPAILAARASGTYFPLKGFSKSEYKAIKNCEVGYLKCSVIYGHPSGSYLRRATFEMRLDFFKRQSGDLVNWVSKEPIDVSILQ